LDRGCADYTCPAGAHHRLQLVRSPRHHSRAQISLARAIRVARLAYTVVLSGDLLLYARRWVRRQLTA
jgi:hypothetical protein